MSTDEAGPAATAERVLAAVVFAVVSLLLVAALLRDSGGTVPGNGTRPAPSRSAGRP